ncbi:hypothetical protein XENOCAPTIV_030663, partial [Xenoophorus captivus]
VPSELSLTSDCTTLARTPLCSGCRSKVEVIMHVYLRHFRPRCTLNSNPLQGHAQRKGLLK